MTFVTESIENERVPFLCWCITVGLPLNNLDEVSTTIIFFTVVFKVFNQLIINYQLPKIKNDKPSNKKNCNNIIGSIMLVIKIMLADYKRIK